MSANQARLELFVDLPELAGQRALALPALGPSELVGAILDEFHSLGQLSDRPGDYRLLRAADGVELDPAAPIGAQLAGGERLVLAEREPPLPPDTRRPTWRVYLRDEAASAVYTLHWQPAVIGRAGPGRPVAIDLAGHPRGLRVARRHAAIGEQGGRLFVQRLSPSPTTLLAAGGATTSLDGRPHPLEDGDTISLDASAIALRVIVHPKEPAQ